MKINRDRKKQKNVSIIIIEFTLINIDRIGIYYKKYYLIFTIL